MTDNSWYSGENKAAREKVKRAQDLYDLNNELRGVDVGKIPRFLSQAQRDEIRGRHSKEHDAQTRLTLLLTSPSYAAIYHDTMSALSDAESAVYDELVISAERLADKSSAIEKAKEHGATTQDIALLQQEHDQAEQRHALMTEYQTELRDIRERMEDPEDPSSLEDLESFKDRLENIRADAISDQDNQSELNKDSDIGASISLNLEGLSPV